MRRFEDADGCEMETYETGTQTLFEGSSAEFRAESEEWWVYAGVKRPADKTPRELGRCRCPKLPDGATLIPFEVAP